MSEPKKEFTDRYWICDECAKEKGWHLPQPLGLTALHGKCAHCKSGIEELLLPVVDYSGPGKKAIWD